MGEDGGLNNLLTISVLDRVASQLQGLHVPQFSVQVVSQDRDVVVGEIQLNKVRQRLQEQHTAR